MINTDILFRNTTELQWYEKGCQNWLLLSDQTKYLAFYILKYTLNIIASAAIEREGELCLCWRLVYNWLPSWILPAHFWVSRQLVLAAMSAGLWLARHQMVTGTASSCFVYPEPTDALGGTALWVVTGIGKGQRPLRTHAIFRINNIDMLFTMTVTLSLFLLSMSNITLIH